MTRSTDGKRVVMPGYATSTGGSSLSASASTVVPRTVGLVDALGRRGHPPRL